MYDVYRIRRIGCASAFVISFFMSIISTVIVGMILLALSPDFMRSATAVGLAGYGIVAAIGTAISIGVLVFLYNLAVSLTGVGLKVDVELTAASSSYREQPEYDDSSASKPKRNTK